MQNVNENSTVIMSIMSNIFKFYKNMQSGAEDSYNKKRKTPNTINKSSIMKVSKDLVMSFPVICSTSISPQTAVMIQRAIENNCVTTLQMIFASASLQGSSGVEVIKQWHNNISGDVSMDDYFDYIESLGDGISNAISLHNSAELERYGKEMIAECKRNEVFYPVSNFSETSLLSYELFEGKDGSTKIKTVNEAQSVPLRPDGTLPKGYVWVKVADPTSSTGYTLQAMADDTYKAAAYDAKELNNAIKSQLDIDQFEDKKLKDIRQDEYRKASDEYQRAKDNLDAKQQLFQKQLLDSDIKKANELTPSMMIIRYTTPNNVSFDGNKVAVVDQFIAGVKARLIGCDSVEIIDRIRLSLENKVDLKNFIRATTGEIKFCKDFLLAIDQAKIEAKRNSKLSKTSPIWRALQNRATKSTYKRITKKTNTAAAITSLVITAEEVNRLNTMYNIDLYNISKARQVMESYNFMELIIVDEALEIARFLLDNDDKYYQDYSFTALRKEMSDSEMKKVINLLSANNRG